MIKKLTKYISPNPNKNEPARPSQRKSHTQETAFNKVRKFFPTVCQKYGISPSLVQELVKRKKFDPFAVMNQALLNHKVSPDKFIATELVKAVMKHNPKMISPVVVNKIINQNKQSTSNAA